MKNKVALVTGGMGGIGSAICESLAKQGATVIATYNRQGNHDAAKTWQQEQSFPVEARYVDVSDFTSCAAMVKEVESEFGRIDILINNAGITSDSQLHKM